MGDSLGPVRSLAEGKPGELFIGTTKNAIVRSAFPDTLTPIVQVGRRFNARWSWPSWRTEWNVSVLTGSHRRAVGAGCPPLHGAVCDLLSGQAGPPVGRRLPSAPLEQNHRGQAAVTWMSDAAKQVGNVFFSATCQDPGRSAGFHPSGAVVAVGTMTGRWGPSAVSPQRTVNLWPFSLLNSITHFWKQQSCLLTI